VGERGVKPAIIVWELKTGAVIAELRGHKHGVAAIAWEPLQTQTNELSSGGIGDASTSANEASKRPLRLASCGFKLDRQVLLWDWRHGAVVAKGRTQHKVHALSFSPAGTYLVTAGERHVKFWDVPAPLSADASPNAATAGANNDGEVAGNASTESAGLMAGGVRDGTVVQMAGRLAAVVEALRGAVFVDMACSNNRISSSGGDQSCIAFAVTAKGQLCAFDAAAATITSLVALEASAAYSISVQPTTSTLSSLAVNNSTTGSAPGMVAVGCSSGLVRLFEATPELRYVVTLPQPPPVGFLNFKSVEDLTRITEPATAVDDNDAKGTIVRAGTDPLALRFPAAMALQWLMKPQRGLSSSAVADLASPASPTSVAWQLVAIYGDRSFFVWDITSQPQSPELLPSQQLQQLTNSPAIEASTENDASAAPSASPQLPVASVVVGKYRSFLHHAACVWDVCALPLPQTSAALPSSPVGCRFATCAADNTVRVWSLDNHSSSNSTHTSNNRALTSDGSATAMGSVQEPPPPPRAPNFFSREMVYAFTVAPSDVPRGAAAAMAKGPDLSLRPQVDRGGGDMGGAVVVDEVIDLEAPPCRVDRPEQLACPRALAASQDGCDLACGDRAGNVRVWALRSRSSADPQQPPPSPEREGSESDKSAIVARSESHPTRTANTEAFPLVYAAAAHDAEVLCLDYADLPPIDEHDPSSSGNDEGRRGGAFEALLATAGRDRLIHVLGAKAPTAPKQPHSQDGSSGSSSSGDGGYALLQTCEHHGGAVVTALRFGPDGSKLFSGGGDGSMSLARVCLPSHHPLPSSSSPRHQSEASRTSPPPPAVSPYRSVALPHGAAYDFGAYPTGKYVVCGGNDKQLHVYSAASGKHVRAYSAEPPLEPGAPAAAMSAKTGSSSTSGSGGGGAVYRLTVDSSGLYAACCTFDRWVRLMDFHSGEVLAQVAGHAELVTSLKFTADGKRLVSGGGDGCVFVWKLGSPLVGAMADRAKELEVQRTKRRAELRAAAKASTTAAHAAAANVPALVDTTADDGAREDDATTAPAAGAQVARVKGESNSSPSKSPRLRGKWAAKLSADGGAYNVLNAYQMTPMSGGGQAGESDNEKEASLCRQQRTLVGGKDLDTTEDEEDDSFDLVDPPLMARTQQPPTLDDEDTMSSFPLGERGRRSAIEAKRESPEDGDGVEMAESPNDPSSAADVSNEPMDAFPVGPTMPKSASGAARRTISADYSGSSPHLDAPKNAHAQPQAFPEGSHGTVQGGGMNDGGGDEGGQEEDEDSSDADPVNDMLGRMVRSASWAPPHHARSLKLSDDDENNDVFDKDGNADGSSSSPDRLSFTQSFRQTSRIAAAAANSPKSADGDAHAEAPAAAAGALGISEAETGAPGSSSRQESSSAGGGGGAKAGALVLEVATDPTDTDAKTEDPNPAFSSPVRAPKPTGNVSAVAAENEAAGAAADGDHDASPTSGGGSNGESNDAVSLMSENTAAAARGPSHAGHGFSTPGKPKRNAGSANSPFNNDADANPSTVNSAVANSQVSSTTATNVSHSRQQPRASSAGGTKGVVRRSLADERERLRSRDRRRDTATALQSMNDQLASMGFLKPSALQGDKEESGDNASTPAAAVAAAAPAAPATVVVADVNVASASSAVIDATHQSNPLVPSSLDQGEVPGSGSDGGGLARVSGETNEGYVSSPAASTDNAPRGNEKQSHSLDGAPRIPSSLPQNNLNGEVVPNVGDNDDNGTTPFDNVDGYGQRSPLIASLATTVSGTTISGETLDGFLVLEGRDNDENNDADGVSHRHTEITTISHKSHAGNDNNNEDDNDTLAQGWTGFLPNAFADEQVASSKLSPGVNGEVSSHVDLKPALPDGDAPDVAPASSAEATAVGATSPLSPLLPTAAAGNKAASEQPDQSRANEVSADCMHSGQAAPEAAAGRLSPNSSDSNDSDNRYHNNNASVSSSGSSSSSGMGPLVLPRPAEEYRASLARLQTAAHEVAQLYSELRGHAYRTGTVNSSSSFIGPTTNSSIREIGHSMDAPMLSAGWAPNPPPSGGGGSGTNGDSSTDGRQNQHNLNLENKSFDSSSCSSSSNTVSHPSGPVVPAWGVAELLGEFDSTWRGLGAAGLGQLPSTSASVDVSGVSFASGSALSVGFGGSVMGGSFLGAPPPLGSSYMYPGSSGDNHRSPWRTPEKAPRSLQPHHQRQHSHSHHHQLPAAQPSSFVVGGQDRSDAVGGAGPAALFASAARPVPLSVRASAPMAALQHHHQPHQQQHHHHLNYHHAQRGASSAEGYNNDFTQEGNGSEMAGMNRNPLPCSQSVDTGGLAPILERAISIGSSDRPGSSLGSEGDPTTPSDRQSTGGLGFDNTLDGTLVDLALPPARPAPPPPTSAPPPPAAEGANGAPLLLPQPHESLPDSALSNVTDGSGQNSSSETSNEALLPPAISAILSAKETTGGQPPPPEVAHLLAQYSDVLLGMVQERLLHSPAAGTRSSSEVLNEAGAAREGDHESLPPPPFP